MFNIKYIFTKHARKFNSPLPRATILEKYQDISIYLSTWAIFFSEKDFVRPLIL